MPPHRVCTSSICARSVQFADYHYLNYSALPHKGQTSLPALATSRVGWILPPPPPPPRFLQSRSAVCVCVLEERGFICKVLRSVISSTLLKTVMSEGKRKEVYISRYMVVAIPVKDIELDDRSKAGIYVRRALPGNLFPLVLGNAAAS
jgi:hypothetical protein